MGEDDTGIVSEKALDFLSLMLQPNIALDITSYLAKSIIFQFQNYHIFGLFRYPFVLVYMLLYVHVDKFGNMGLNTWDSKNEIKSMIEWTSIVRKKENKEGFPYYLSSFMTTVYTIFNNQQPLRILPKAKELLPLSKETKVGNWYIFKVYTKIRFYGAEVPPYHLPIFFPMTIFSLEFIRNS